MKQIDFDKPGPGILTEKERAIFVKKIRRYFKRSAKIREKYELDFRDKKSSIALKDRNRFMRMVLQTRKYERRHIAYVFNVHRSVVRDTSKRIHFKFAELMAYGHPIQKVAKHLNLSLPTAKMLRDFPIVDTSSIVIDHKKRSRLMPSVRGKLAEKRKANPFKVNIIRVCPKHLDGCPKSSKKCWRQPKKEKTIWSQFDK